MIASITKRDGRVVPFDSQKIQQAIEKSFIASGSRKGKETAHHLTEFVVSALESNETIPSVPTVEQVQDAVERILIEQGFVRSAKAYILYRAERSRVREMNTSLMKTFEDICFPDTKEHDSAHEQAVCSAGDALLRFGSEAAKQFYEMFVLDPKYAAAHREGDLHIHHLDSYTLTPASVQIDLRRLLSGGFMAGHAAFREPQDISSYAALCCIAVETLQNDRHGCLGIADFDYGMAPGVQKSYHKHFRANLARVLEIMLGLDEAADKAAALLEELYTETKKQPCLTPDAALDKALAAKLKTLGEIKDAQGMIDFARAHAESETEQATHQAMEALVHRFSAAAREGVAYPAINYGLDPSPEGRMVMRNLLTATEEGVGSGVTPVSPVQVFRVKEGVNYHPGEVNYDLLRLAIRVSAGRGMPHFAFLDAPFNLQYYEKDTPDSQTAYMGCRTRVMDNMHDKTRAIAPRRGCLAATTVNLPRIALKAKGDTGWFFEELERMLQLVTGQLMERFEILARKKAAHYPFLMGQGIWLDSETLAQDDSLREVLRHGTLSIGFTGLSETLKSLRGTHHGEDTASQNLGLEIVSFIRKHCDEMSEKHGLNFTCLAAAPEEMAARLLRLDRERFGALPGITGHEQYTDSFHIPEDTALPALEKIALEAPYHALANGGHISIAAMDKAPQQHLDAFEALLRHMHDAGIGCGAVKAKS